MNKITLIQNYIRQGENIKAMHPEIWLDKFNDDLEQLKKFLSLSSMDEDLAGKKFMGLELSNFQSFGDYVKSVNIGASKLKFQTIQNKNKSQRICHGCNGTDFTYIDGVCVCSHCQTVLDGKSSSQLIAKDGIDSSKHSTKQLNILTGTVNPPSIIIRIMPFIEEWFKNKKHIHEWLNYNGNMKKWLRIYNENSSSKRIDESYFNVPFKEGIDNVYNTRIFRLYTDEFYELTSRVCNYYKYENNISSLSDEITFKICQDYYNLYHKVPEDKETFCYESVNLKNPFNTDEYVYDIGKFIVHMKIHDYKSETEFKQRLNQLFNTTLTLPGLIFEYTDICGAKEHIPKKFIYQQNYIYIIHKIFNIAYSEINESDKDCICKIIMDFNAYLKELKKNRTGKNHNSCLWQISLAYILELPYFRCYQGLTRILPIKYSSTIASIKEVWTLFLIINAKKMEPYTTILRKEFIKESTSSKTIVTTADVNKQQLLDFITNTGSSYNSENNYVYLKKKFNIKNTEHNWVENYNLSNDNLENEPENESSKEENEISFSSSSESDDESFEISGSNSE